MHPTMTCSILFGGLILLVLLGGMPHYANACYSSIISFGDSLADTRNRLLLNSTYPELEFPCKRTPYVQNFIGGVSGGRCSNGCLIIDFLAESLGLPLIQPYLGHNWNVDDNGVVAGVNYAVAGATALDSSFIEDKWSAGEVINTSLGVQLEWFKQSLPSFCGNTSSDCRDFIGRCLFLLGEIGGNDYNEALSVGKAIDEVKPFANLVTDKIISTVNELIEMGARTLIVPGNFPIGCFPSSFTIYGTNSIDLDPITGCLIMLNDFSEYHNRMLQTKLNKTRELNPNVVIMYADYYNALMQIYLSPVEYGFTKEGTSKACCGCGGPFNFDLSRLCGDVCTTVCDEPDTYVGWDGIHLTEEAYKVIFKSLFQGPYTTPKFNSLCPTPSTSKTGAGLLSSI